MDLKLDGEAMQALVAKTLVDSFTPDLRGWVSPEDFARARAALSGQEGEGA